MRDNRGEYGSMVDTFTIQKETTVRVVSLIRIYDILIRTYTIYHMHLLGMSISRPVWQSLRAHQMLSYSLL